MGKRSVIPYGPQHPVLPEPVHLDLVIEDEKVVEAIPNIGFIHRGLESLTEKKDWETMQYVVERTCGICSFMHGMGYISTLEKIFDCEVPDRAKYLRTVWCEFSRIHSHLLWLGLLADAFGFESLFYQCWKIREKILDMVEMTTGGRLINSVNKVGGVLKDITPEMEKVILSTIDTMEAELLEIKDTFFEDYTVQARTKGVGILTKEDAYNLGCCGPFMRASGISNDMRKMGYAAYANIDFEPITSNDGDHYARCYVRMMEVFQSFDIIRQAFSKMPGGEIALPVKGNPNGEAFVRLEQPRGEAVYYIKASGKKNLDRFRLRTPTFANLPGLAHILKGADLSDVGLAILTIDPCISCTER